MPIPEATARLLAALFEQIDGTRTAKDVLGALKAQGVDMSTGEFRELLELLTNHYGIAAMRTPPVSVRRCASSRKPPKRIGQCS